MNTSSLTLLPLTLLLQIIYCPMSLPLRYLQRDFELCTAWRERDELLTFAFTFPSLGSRTSTHQLQQFCLQLGIVPPIIKAVVRVQVEEQPHLQGIQPATKLRNIKAGGDPCMLLQRLSARVPIVRHERPYLLGSGSPLALGWGVPTATHWPPLIKMV